MRFLNAVQSVFVKGFPIFHYKREGSPKKKIFIVVPLLETFALCGCVYLHIHTHSSVRTRGNFVFYAALLKSSATEVSSREGRLFFLSEVLESKSLNFYFFNDSNIFKSGFFYVERSMKRNISLS